MHAGSRDPKTIPLPEGTESFKLFERVQGYAMVNGKAVFVRSDDFNISPGDHYPNATRHTLAEYAALFPEACLVDATRTDLVMVRTQGGRWHRLGPDDAIVERKR